MNRKILFLVAGFFLMILPVAVVAQTATTSAAATSSATMTSDAVSTPDVAPKAAGPTTGASTVGIRAPAAQRSSAGAAAAADPHLGAGQNVALMVVGGAAMIIGAAIGDTAGILLAVGGAVVFLYGLYNFVQ